MVDAMDQAPWERPQPWWAAWIERHPRGLWLLMGLLYGSIATAWLGQPARLIVIAAVVVVTQLLVTSWQARVIRRRPAMIGRARAQYIDWYGRHPDHEPPDWLSRP